MNGNDGKALWEFETHMFEIIKLINTNPEFKLLDLRGYHSGFGYVFVYKPDGKIYRIDIKEVL